jgi:hypothetical protein
MLLTELGILNICADKVEERSRSRKVPSDARLIMVLCPRQNYLEKNLGDPANASVARSESWSKREDRLSSPISRIGKMPWLKARVQAPAGS